MVKKMRRRVSEVLWRLFHNRSPTLADTIISLIPPPPLPPECCCQGWQCLGCSGDGAMSFLLGPDDPSDYRKLLTHRVAVISNNAHSL
ncbi:Telomerase reverse transcriptase [Camellia lanceoleosa]|uniref:Telomerase reverse transcriptase n=1 Tax=Camellia lanceoleosa TaxID=1840588 RepID=A0ACC0GED8_9ERIC|nr:Telomerase reverse transcriptase [Camellia lanceoleosa]